MIMLDNTVVNVALPSIQRDLGVDLAELEWIVTGYALTFAAFTLVGGLLTEHLSWSWIFFVNVPVGVLGIFASFLLIDESRDETHERLDLPGLATSAVGLFALTYGLIEANGYGWGSTRIVGSFLIAAVSLFAFVVLERRQHAPMLDLSLFRSGTYTGANLVVLLVA